MLVGNAEPGSRYLRPPSVEAASKAPATTAYKFPQSARPYTLRYIVREPPPPQPVPLAVPRPVDEEGLALDLVALHEAPVPAVLRVVAVVAHDEVAVGGHAGGLAAVGVAAVRGGARERGVAGLHVGLHEGPAVHEDLL